MNADTAAKVAKLPSWARDLIRELEQAAKPNRAEVSLLQQNIANREKCIKRLKQRIDFMEAILKAADRGGNETAAEYVKSQAEYYLIPESEG